jgi:hypothetical protein
MSNVLIYPINITFKEWASQMRNAFPSLYFPNPLEISEWRFWADQVIIANGLHDRVLPLRLVFPNHEDWRKWAAYFINSLPA